VLGVLTEVVFPLRCAGCGRPGAAVCERCRDEIRLIDPRAACPRCGAPLAGTVCAECAGRAFAFSHARCAALLAGPVARAIVLYKDSGERRYAALLGALVAEAAGEWLAEADAIAPVPASRAAVVRRGYDHIGGLAHVLSLVSGVPVLEALCARSVLDQRTLGREERFRNRQGSFTCRSGISAPPRVILVDDVFTTGATLDAAAAALVALTGRAPRVVAVARACDEASRG
jgi:predicted amidophosphoribosyltransferase